MWRVIILTGDRSFFLIVKFLKYILRGKVLTGYIIFINVLPVLLLFKEACQKLRETRPVTENLKMILLGVELKNFLHL